jgi:hypothetical protein
MIGINEFWIKIIALIAMVIDHIGMFFYPDMVVLRMIGRLSFPLFAWLIANGAYHTRNMNGYLVRLFVLAVITQWPYLLVRHQINPFFFGFNPLFDLFLGLVAIKAIGLPLVKWKKAAAVAVCALAASFFGVEYGITGVLSVVFFYLYFNDRKKMVVSQALIYIIPYLAKVLPPFLVSGLPRVDIGRYCEPLGLLSLLIIFLYNGKQGVKMKYFFYFFYPLQFAAIFIVKSLVK